MAAAALPPAPAPAAGPRVESRLQKTAPFAAPLRSALFLRLFLTLHHRRKSDYWERAGVLHLRRQHVEDEVSPYMEFSPTSTAFWTRDRMRHAADMIKLEACSL